MKYLLVVLAIALLSVGCGEATPAASTEQVFTPPKERRVVVIGDSYTGGSAEGGQGTGSWPALVWESFGQRYLPVASHVSVEGGAGYAKRGQEGHVFADKLDDVVDVNTDLLIFLGGRNDGAVPPDVLADSARDAYAKARTLAPNAKLLVIGPVWPNPDVPPVIERVRDIVRDEAQQAGATFVDPLAEGWLQNTPELIGADGIHPTDEGHEFLAAKIGPLIEDALNNLHA